MAVEWNDDAVTAQVRAKLTQNMLIVNTYLQGEVRKDINRGNVGGGNPSKPGEPPKKDTGRLFRSIATAISQTANSISGAIGTNVKYARRLELGFAGKDSKGRNINQAPRPFLRPQLKKHKDRILRLLSR